jgi:very-short-patch-repair endonuclease
VACQQLELITTPQLRAAGISKDATATRRSRGSLHRIHHGVYLFGSPLMLPGARELAAVLACGDRSFVSHRSAAALWGLAAGFADKIDITAVGARRCRAGIRTHVVAGLDPMDRYMRNGIPVTAPARTLLDFASQGTTGEIELAVAEAYAHKLVTEPELKAAIGRALRRPGASVLRAELKREGGPQWTQSEAERRMLRLIRAAGLPLPRTQLRIAGWPADFVWVEQRLIVEVDGYAFHSHRRAFERDRRRDQTHMTAGYIVLRFTWRQMQEEPFVVIATIARALGSPRRMPH